MNFQKGTIYRNVEPLEHGVFTGSKLTLVMSDRENHMKIERKEFMSHSGSYQWENFFRAVNGERLGNKAAVWEIIEGIKII